MFSLKSRGVGSPLLSSLITSVSPNPDDAEKKNGTAGTVEEAAPSTG